MSTDLNFIAHTNVECDVCNGRKRKKAAQSCLECVASFCDTHIELHNILHVGKRHKLVMATGRFKETICPEHDKVLEIFCCTDQQCICHMCITDKHKSHKIVSIKEEVAKKKIKLKGMQRQSTEMIQSHEKEEQKLKQAIEAFQTSAGEAVKGNLKPFTELILFMEKIQYTVKELIMSQAKAVVKEVDELLERLNLDIGYLKKIDTELQHLKRLSEADNAIHFLQSASSVSNFATCIQVPALLVQPHCSFQLATDALSDLITKLNIIWQWRFITISERVKNTGIVSSPLPETRQELLKYACQLTVDPNTVNNYLRLTKQNMELTAVHESEDYPYHPERFERRVQALCKKGLWGSPLYWEVECGTKGSWVSIALSYKGICRKGKKAPLFGQCKSSWALRNTGGLFEYWHESKGTFLKSPCCFRVGIYLDHSAGTLAFYNVSDNVSIIFKVQTNFTEPVYFGFGLAGIGCQVTLCDLKD